uniref:Protein AAR2 homolog n=1 Tax=Ornithodoros turicata TaxID=34597 RepID=A0A2R5LBP6_9ACAR
MDPEVAKKLLREGATLVLLDIPPGSEFGMDMVPHNTGEKFKGIKLIPPGLHFVFYSSVSSAGTTAPRTGFFHYFQGGEVLVKKWDRIAEDIQKEEVSQEEVEKFRSHLEGDLDRFLGVYAYHDWRRWISLTKHISEDVLKRLQPESGKIYSATPFEPLHFLSERSGHREVSAGDPAGKSDPIELKEAAGTAVRYTPFPKHKYPDNASPAEITHHSIDSTYLLDTLLAACPEEGGLLGELQFAFVCFLVGHSYSGFEQWQKIIRVLCTSADAVPRQVDLYDSLLSVLYFQLREIPSDFFVDIVSRENFLTATLSELFRNIAEAGTGNADPGLESLKKKALRFKGSIGKLFGWSFDEEPDDEQPVVVDLAEQN